ncbi:hexosyltransferase [Clostridia bacterium]|nr:hexosyltransferase [Clostridia bacterium]
MRKKIAIINQRYGLEVNGGSEQYTRLLAERLTEKNNVEILTTCALDYTTWDNHFSEGTSVIHDVPVRRFPVDQPRDIQRFAQVSERVYTTGIGNAVMEAEWIDEQGPLCTKLIQYIKDHADRYDVFIFVTYLYYLTVQGMGLVKDRSILIPTAHDEPPIRLHTYKSVFHAPIAIGYNTEEERDFVHTFFGNNRIPSEILGIGIDIPDIIDTDAFRKKYALDNYLIYVGRIDESKGCAELFDFFTLYKEENPSDLKLVLMGKEVMDVPTNPDIISLGFVSDEDKFNGIAGAKTLLLPSLFESLSMSVLESLALGVPVIVNGGCEVLRGHCLRSNAGMCYTSYDEFEKVLHFLLSHEDDYLAMSVNGANYVAKNYDWTIIMNKLQSLIDRIPPVSEIGIIPFRNFEERYFDLISDFEHVQTELDHIRGEINGICQSKTYKFARALGKPLRAVRNRRTAPVR